MAEIISLEPVDEQDINQNSLEEVTGNSKIRFFLALHALLHFLAFAPLAISICFETYRELITLPILISLMVTIILSSILNIIILLLHYCYGKFINFILTSLNATMIALTVLFCYKAGGDLFWKELLYSPIMCIVIFIHNWYLILFVYSE